VNKVIGRLTHPLWAAELRDDGTWAATMPEVAEVLNAGHSPLERYSPADGAFGLRELHRAGKELGAEVEVVTPPAPPEAGRVY
jgi:hypothetical protein